MSEIQTKLDYADAVADWFLGIGEALIRRGELEEGLKCVHIAATIFCRQNRNLSSARIESNLQSVARCLGECHGLRAAKGGKSGRIETCLHVMSHALPLGGVTAMATRWMTNDQSGRIHSVALLSQEIPVPDQLLQAARATGGDVYSADPNDSFLQRAVWLRNLANDLASYVVLHIDVSDVIAGVAFGINGGPPVLLVNHTAHVYWTGTSITDLILNCRGSALEGVWAATYRGTPRYATIPIPLLNPNPSGSGENYGKGVKGEAKKRIGLPEGSNVILTVGASFKYLPANGLDFIAVCESIISELPDAFLLVVGTPEDERWLNASIRSGSRIRALGTLPQTQLGLILEATDVYVEGFPFGTTTSLLEAALRGIPVVLAPVQCPPPYGSDGIALDDVLERPRSAEEYKNMVIHLCKTPSDRESWGSRVRSSVAKHHTGSGWRQHLEEAMAKLPREHSVYPPSTPVRTLPDIHEYWSNYLIKWNWGYEATLENAFMHALAVGLKPRLTKEVLQSCRIAKASRTGHTIPLPVLVFLCNFLLPLVPTAPAGIMFRFIAFLCRGSLLSRVRNKIASLFRDTGCSHSAYEEYRRVPGHHNLNLSRDNTPLKGQAQP